MHSDPLLQGRTLRRRLPGVVLVILLHVALVYALFSGLGRKLIDVVRAPVETRVIEEPKKPPPPLQQVALPPPPMNEPPPPPFIPPPEIRIAPPPPAPRIVVATPKPPPKPVVLAPAPMPAPPAPPSPPSPPAPAAPRLPPAPPSPPAVVKPPAVVTAGVACANYRSKMGEVSYPRQAVRLGLDQGEALIQFTLKADGRVTDVKALSATHRVFAQASIRTVEQFRCAGQGRDVTVRVPFGYRLR